MGEDDIVVRWNALATTHGLCQILKMTKARRGILKARVRDAGGEAAFWSGLEFALARRGLWAVSRGFPSFDQALQESTFQKLVEGFYNGRPGGDDRVDVSPEEAERRRLLRVLKENTGRTVGDGIAAVTIGSSATTNFNGYEQRYDTMPTERLKLLVERIKA